MSATNLREEITPGKVAPNQSAEIGYRRPIFRGDARFIVTPAVYPRLVEFLHFDIQSTGQKSHCVNTVSGPRNALF